MNKSQNTSTNNRVFAIIIVLCLISMILIEFLTISFFDDPQISNMFADIVSRILGGIIFVFVLKIFRFNVFQRFHTSIKDVLIIVIPALLISVNNFPFIAFLNGNAEVTSSFTSVFVFAVQCFSVGLFEEMVFRGFILVILLQRFQKTKTGIFQAIMVSSAIFGSMHLLNIFTGASFGPTILQVGYSFLTGLMWSVVFVATRNLWTTIGLHAIYNFLGLIFFELGTIQGKNDIITILVTVVLSGIVALYYISILQNLRSDDVEKLYN